MSSIFVWTQNWLESQGVPHQALSLCESTNTLSKNHISSHPPIFVYLAELQTHGRGRNDHTWSSPPPGTGLLSTWCFKVHQAPQYLLSPLIGLACYRACRATWPNLELSLKAPNDIYIKNKKCGGILIETVQTGSETSIHIGIGLNILSHPLHVETSTAVQEHLPEPLTFQKWEQFLQQLLQQMQITIIQAAKAELGADVAEALKQALQKHPLFTDLIHVSPEGNLIFSDRELHWFDL